MYMYNIYFNTYNTYTYKYDMIFSTIMAIKDSVKIFVRNSKQNSLGITFPKSISQDSLCKFDINSKLEMELVNDELIIRKVTK